MPLMIEFRMMWYFLVVLVVDVDVAVAVVVPLDGHPQLPFHFDWHWQE